MSMDPSEIIVGPLTLYLAPAVEPEDDVSSAPSGNWVLVGTSGDENYSEAGIVITHGQTLRETFVVGATEPIKVNRQQESLAIGFSLMDLSIAQYTRALSGTAKSTDTTPNIDYIGLSRGPNVTVYSLIARGVGMSTSGAALDMLFYIPRCYQSADPAPTFSKDIEAMLAVTYNALEYQSAGTDEERFGRFVVETS